MISNYLLGKIKTLRQVLNKVAQPKPPKIYQITQQEVSQIQHDLEKMLYQNIIPFWYPEVIDDIDGGYRLNQDVHGTWKGQTNKCIVTQARTVWFFSKLINTELGLSSKTFPKEKLLKAAYHGYQFLRQRMWDKEYGGFYWQVDSSGKEATQPHKQLFGQAAALYGLSEYAIATQDAEVKAFTQEIFHLIEARYRDSLYGGYQEFYLQDWSIPKTNSRSYFNTPANSKLINSHLHLTEAILTYYTLTQDVSARTRLEELLIVHTNTTVSKTAYGCTQIYQSDWTPIYLPGYDGISFGHTLENIWVIITICQTLGISNTLFLSHYRQLFNYLFKYGFDVQKGGFYDKGKFNKLANLKDKYWRVQGEGLVSLLHLYDLTKEEVYFQNFSKTLDWIFKYQTDWQHGEWHEQITKNGQSIGDKASVWKCPYHSSRAVIQCISILNRFNAF
jgi:mannose/cellobiose epimerase-like protein (N-acyl-D-glucosamine 2-epimerase family)